MTWRQNLIRGGSVFVVALAVRLLALTQATGFRLSGDEAWYWEVAEGFVQGSLISTIRPPLWSGVLALPALFSDSPFGGRFAATLVGAATPVLVYAVATRCFGRRTGLVGGLLLALYPTHVGHSHYLWSEVLSAFIATGCVYLFLVSLDHPERPNWLRGTFLLLGIGLLAEELTVVLCVALVSALVVGGTLRRPLALGVLLICFGLPGSIYSAIASYHTGNPVLVASAVMGNRAQLEMGGFAMTGKGEAVPGESVDSLEAFGAAISTARDLGSRVDRALWNAGSLWSPTSYLIWRLRTQHPEDRYPTAHREPWVWLSVAFYLVLCAAGATGLVLSRSTVLTTLTAFSLGLLTCLSAEALMLTRFRLPFMPLVAIFAAVFLTQGRDLIRARRSEPGWRLRCSILPVLLLGLAAVTAARVPLLGREPW